MKRKPLQKPASVSLIVFMPSNWSLNLQADFPPHFQSIPAGKEQQTAQQLTARATPQWDHPSPSHLLCLPCSGYATPCQASMSWIKISKQFSHLEITCRRDGIGEKKNPCSQAFLHHIQQHRSLCIKSMKDERSKMQHREGWNGSTPQISQLSKAFQFSLETLQVQRAYETRPASPSTTSLWENISRKRLSALARMAD